MKPIETETLVRELRAFQASPRDGDAAAAAALALGTLAEHDAPHAGSVVASLESSLRAALLETTHTQHERHRTRIAAHLVRVAERPSWMTTHAILTDDHAGATRAQRCALDALSSREALHRLECGAGLLSQDPPRDLATARASLDAQLRSTMSSWLALAPWRGRAVEALGVNASQLDGRWWVTEWPADPTEELDDEDLGRALAPVVAWVAQRLQRGARGVLSLTAA